MQQLQNCEKDAFDRQSARRFLDIGTPKGDPCSPELGRRRCRGMSDQILRSGAVWLGLLAILVVSACASEASAAGNKPLAEAGSQRFPRFVVSFPSKAHAEPITARVLLFFSRSRDGEPRYAFNVSDRPPVYAIEVTGMKP